VRFLSTRGGAPPVGLGEALLQGLAPDGGLYLPETIPRLVPTELVPPGGPDLAATAAAMLAPYAAGEIQQDELAALVAEALDFPIPLVPLEDGVWVLELHHGPTLAFKDVAARTMARLMARLREPGRPMTVLVATSGDTGSAVASAFFGVEGIRVVVLYPEGRVSAVQERQLTSLGGNVTAVAVDGSFDDCQRLAKAAFADHELVAACGLTSANSINIGRLLPQSVYYAHAVAQLGPCARPPLFVVPSGNLGNLTAGVIASRMGVPSAGFVAAANRNDTLPEFLETGRFRPRPAVATLSNAMDVGNPSNFERLLALFDGDHASITRAIAGSRHDDEATVAAIADVHRRTGAVLDPHTAVGYLALRRRISELGGERPAVLLATAHPAKFADAVSAAIGAEVPLPDRLAACHERPMERLRLPAEVDALRAVLVKRET